MTFVFKNHERVVWTKSPGGRGYVPPARGERAREAEASHTPPIYRLCRVLADQAPLPRTALLFAGERGEKLHLDQNRTNSLVFKRRAKLPRGPAYCPGKDGGARQGPGKRKAVRTRVVGQKGKQQ